jgi:LPXTG-site transpeptidase (sortase) family protein
VTAIPDIDTPALETEHAAPTAAPTPATASFIPSQPVRVVIDAIGMDRPLIRVGLDDNRIPIVPMHDVGWYQYSAYPGEGDNIVLWGHVLRFKAAPDIPAPFARLHEVSMGDELTLYTARGTRHAYVVTEQVWATPEQVEYILPQGTEQLTLVSCIGDTVIEENTTRMTHRLITIARPRP